MFMQEHVSLAPYTTLRVGGPARYLVTVSAQTELVSTQAFITETGLPYLILGGGSNVLISDTGFAGIVVCMNMRGVTYTTTDTDGQVIADVAAGELLDDVIVDTVKRGYWGLENLSHIPGTVGAVPIQNVGAYGVETADLVQSVTAYHLGTGEQKTFTASDCQFGYRDSFFKTAAGQGWCITQVSFRLSANPTPVVTYGELAQFAREHPEYTQTDIRNQIVTIRSGKFPDWTTVGTAGSFFKNPVISTALAKSLQRDYPDLPCYPMDDDTTKVSLGYILDRVCRLKGYQCGRVGLYENQALVLVSNGASAVEIAAFVEEIVGIVFARTGITIEQEVRSV